MVILERHAMTDTLSRRLSSFIITVCALASFNLYDAFSKSGGAWAEVYVERGDLKPGWIGRSMPATAERDRAMRIIEIRPPGPGRDFGVILFGDEKTDFPPHRLRGPR